MEQIFNSLKALVDPLVAKAATTLEEREDKVSQAASGILPGLLAKLASKGSNPQVENAITDAARANILPHLSAVFGTKGEVEQESIGNKLYRALMGDKSNDFANAVSADSGLSKSSTNKLIGMISTAIAGFFGDKIKNGGYTLTGIIQQLNSEKGAFLGSLPAGVAAALGLTSASATTGNPPKKKGGMGWLIWLLVAIALILLIIFGWRSCKNKSAKEVTQQIETKTEQVVENVKTTVQETVKSLTEFTLPNGVKIKAYKNGMEDKMIAFLNSDAYKNTKTDADLANKWFEFEEIDFARDSATELDAKADSHISNIAAILKAYPQAKIKIGGNADKSGNRLYNMEISKERASTIKSLLVKAGIAANRISTEGFGDEHAVWPADTSESKSSEDRDIAFRFTK